MYVFREIDAGEVKSIVTMSNNETVITSEKNEIHRFTFDHSFWSFDQSSPNSANQLTIYEAIGLPLLDKVFEGYNACLLAYGPTGSGKSYRFGF